VSEDSVLILVLQYFCDGEGCRSGVWAANGCMLHHVCFPAASAFARRCTSWHSGFLSGTEGCNEEGGVREAAARAVRSSIWRRRTQMKAATVKSRRPANSRILPGENECECAGEELCCGVVGIALEQWYLLRAVLKVRPLAVVDQSL